MDSAVIELVTFRHLLNISCSKALFTDGKSAGEQISTAGEQIPGQQVKSVEVYSLLILHKLRWAATKLLFKCTGKIGRIVKIELITNFGN